MSSSLNSAQQLASETLEGNLLILAGPGTGKTRVIVSKVENLLKKGISAEAILAVTFSRKATQEMEERLAALSVGLPDRMKISTLHALCAEIVEQHGFRLGFQKKPRIMTESEAYVFFKKVSSRLPLQPLLKTSNFDPIIEDLINFFADCKDEGLWPESIVRYAESLPEESSDEIQIKEEWRALGDIYNAHQSFCFESGLMDFGDAILSALRILEEFAIVREEIQKKYQAILVDEFQDTNWSQIKLLRLLAAPTAHVMVVGDDDQSIYRFRGASYSAFKFFEEFFSEPKIVELQETYRLPSSILECASHLISANGEHRFRPDKRLVSKKKNDLPVNLVKTNSYEDEAIFICDEIENLLSSGASPKEIGLLVRAHSHAEYFLAEARKRGLPVQTSTTRSFFEEPVIKDALAVLKLICDPTDSVSFLRLFDSSFLQISADDTFSFCRAIKRNGPFVDQLENLSEMPISDSAKEKLKLFYAAYKELFLEASKKTATQVLLSFYEKLPFIRSLLEKDPEALRLLGRFHVQLSSWESAQGDGNLKSLFPILESLKENSLSLDAEGDTGISGSAISVLTAHASKGLEFDYVFIPSLVGRRFPSAFRKNTWLVPDALRKEAAPNKESHLEEERRLFYVAMTRARERLTLTCIEKKGTKPSIFLLGDLKSVLSQPKVLKLIEREPSPASMAEKLFTPIKPFSRFTQPSESKEKAKKPLSLSFTQLEKYESCPLAYQFKYDFQIPVEVPPHMSVGSAIHTALELFFRGIKKGAQPSKEELVGFFEKAFKDLQANDLKLNETHLDQGKTKLAEYHDFHKGSFPFPHAVEEDFILPLGEHRIRGKIDRIDKTNEGYRIVDYKTGRAKSNDNPDDVKFAKHSLQFSIYALAAKEILKIEVSDLVFDYVYEKKTLTTTRSNEDLIQVKKQMSEIAENILNQNFTATPGMHCKWCEYKAICPAVK
ncbi:MAG: hypothetical protein JWQ35_713 [Bacteriovoracaceae bacterium]|nr:hypothetical protein [Bacteriovoracaceae bacterium]